MMTWLAVAMAVVSVAVCDKGVMDVDDIALSKLIGGPHHLLVALLEYSWKTPTGFDAVSEAFKEQSDTLIAKVDTSSLPEGSAFKVDKKPTVRFYAAGATTHVDFGGDADDSAAVIEFVHTQLSPQLKDLKGLAMAFMGASEKTRKSLAAQVDTLVASLDAKFHKLGQLYAVTMKRVLEKGTEFVATESKRISALTESKNIAADKVKEFKQRLSVLASFAAGAGNVKSEL